MELLTVSRSHECNCHADRFYCSNSHADYILIHIGHLFNKDFDLTLNYIFGKIFYPFAWSMGVPTQDVSNAATLLGQKLTINEFVAFKTSPINRYLF
jgi:nucleoside permease NupC